MGHGHTKNWKASHASGEGKPTSTQPGVFDDLYYSFPIDPEAKPGEPTGQLYNMEKDPYERHNLWSENPEVVIELLRLLNAEREKTD